MSTSSKKAVRFSCALGLLALVTVGASSGCEEDVIEAVCDEICTCQPCTEDDRADCEVKAAASEAAASDSSCSSLFDAYTRCLQENLRCEGTFATSDRCRTELDLLSGCTNAPPPFADPCMAATGHIADCTLVVNSTSGPGGPLPPELTCAGSRLCSSICINEAPCEQIRDAFSKMPTSVSQPFLDCSTRCFGPK